MRSTFPSVIAVVDYFGPDTLKTDTSAQIYLKFKDGWRTCCKLCGLAGTQAPFSYAPVRGLRVLSEASAVWPHDGLKTSAG